MRFDPPANAFVMPIQVVGDDVDEQGHVSNVTVVKWMSRAAYAHSAAMGWDLDRYRDVGAWFVVRRHEIDYHRFALAGDRLTLATWPSELGKATAERRHVIRRTSDDALIATGLNIWAFVDAATGRPRRIPDAARQAFAPFID